MNSVEGDMVVKDPSTGAKEDLEVKGMNVVMYACTSLVLVQPDKEAWHSFGHGGTLLAHVGPGAYLWARAPTQTSKEILLFKACAAKCRNHEALSCNAQWQRGGQDHLICLI